MPKNTLVRNIKRKTAIGNDENRSLLEGIGQCYALVKIENA